MTSHVIVGYAGNPRCAWAGAGDTAFGRYHDDVWERTPVTVKSHRPWKA